MRWLVLLALPTLMACQDEPDFDERYEAAERQVRETARDIDQRLSASASPGETEPAAPAREGGSTAEAGSSVTDSP